MHEVSPFHQRCTTQPVGIEKAIELTGGQDLSIKVEFAKGYARTLYDQELHDQLVAEVLEASPYADGFTLLNVLAQEQALELARTAPDYF